MTHRLGQPLIRRGVVTSTMDELAALAERGAAEGTALLADRQTAGRGRAGRIWRSEPGASILLSVLLRPTVPSAQLTVLPLIVGVAVAEALEEEVGVDPTLKWPNDLLLNGRKAAGVLVTARSTLAARHVIVGLGLNVNATSDQLPPDATSLRVETGVAHDRERLLAAVFDRLDRAYREFERTGGAFDPAAWARRAAFIGEWVSVETAGQTTNGMFAGVDCDGALILTDQDGERRRIVAGDLNRGPRPAVAGE